MFIISDGWTYMANRPQVNLIVMSTLGPYFLRVGDASGKDSEWIVDRIIEEN
jgi:hypothetical protein